MQKIETNNILDVAPEIAFVMPIIFGIYAEEGLQCRITSVRRNSGDTYHNPEYGFKIACRREVFAVDLGIFDEDGIYRSDKALLISQKLKSRLPECFDIVYNSTDHKDHIHLEYDLKKSNKVNSLY